MIEIRLSDHVCISASFTLQPGTSPSSGDAELTLSDLGWYLRVDRSYDLRISDDQSDVTIRQLYIDGTRYDFGIDRTAQNCIARLRLLDRRWKWKFSYLVGSHNTLQDDGVTVIPETAKTWRELVQLCLDALDETQYRNAVPSAWTVPAPPDVEWKYANAAEELQRLLDLASAVIVLNPNGSLSFYLQGEPTSWSPPETKIAADEGWDFPEKPEAVRVVGSRIIRQVRIADWKPVCEDEAGAIRPLAEVATEFGSSIGQIAAEAQFQKAFASVTNETRRKILQKCAFKWFRMPDSGLNPDGTPQANAHRLPMLKQLAEYNTENGLIVHKDPIVEVNFFRRKHSAAEHENFTVPQVVDKGYTIDEKRGIVKFSDRVGPVTDPSPQLTELTSINYAGIQCNVTFAHELDTGAAADFYSYTHPTAGANLTTGIAIAEKPELVLYQKEDPAGGPVTDLNRVALDAWASAFARNLWDTWRDNLTASYTFPGCHDRSPTGYITMVGWEAGDSGAVTKMEINSERPAPGMPPYRQRNLAVTRSRQARDANRSVVTEARDTGTGAGKRAPTGADAPSGPPDMPEVLELWTPNHKGLIPIHDASGNQEDRIFCEITAVDPTTRKHAIDKVGPVEFGAPTGPDRGGSSGYFPSRWFWDGTMGLWRIAAVAPNVGQGIEWAPANALRHKDGPLPPMTLFPGRLGIDVMGHVISSDPHTGDAWIRITAEAINHQGPDAGALSYCPPGWGMSGLTKDARGHVISYDCKCKCAD